jgi:Skp family chaperone for outer membrane proteins
MNVTYSVLVFVATCSTALIVAEDKVVSTPKPVTTKTNTVVGKKASIAPSSLASKDVIVTDASDILIGVVDLFSRIGVTDAGKEEQKELDAMQRTEANNLEQQRVASTKRLEGFNAKKDTLSKEAREREEQELIALSRDLQNDVQKAQERVRHEMNKATEKLARAAEKAAIEIAQEDKLDLLIEKNTGRVIYSRESYDVSARVEAKMNEHYRVAQAQTTKKVPITLATAATDSSKKEMVKPATEPTKQV